jgi:hypothetical protein
LDISTGVAERDGNTPVHSYDYELQVGRPVDVPPDAGVAGFYEGTVVEENRTAAHVAGHVRERVEVAPVETDGIAAAPLVGRRQRVPGPGGVGVDVVAGAAVDDAARARDAVRAGACGTDLHDAGVRKVYVAADRAEGVRFDATDDEP